MKDAKEAVDKGNLDELLGKVRSQYEVAARDKDVVVIEGTDLADVISLTDASSVFDVNVGIARALDAKVLLVASGGRGKSADEIVADVNASKALCDGGDCDFMGIIINGVPSEQLDETDTTARRELASRGIRVFGVVPYSPVLPRPRVSDIAEKLQAQMLYGKQHLSNLIFHTIVAAMNVGHALSYLREDTLIITPGDRDDIVLGALSSQMSSAYPKIAGILLTGGLHPNESVRKLIEGIKGISVPIILVETDTHTTTSRIEDIVVGIRSDDYHKIGIVEKLVDDYVDEKGIYASLDIRRTRRARPEDFLNRITNLAVADPMRIVFPEGTEDRTLKAAERILQRKIAQVTLVGNSDRIAARARDLGVSLQGASLVDPETEDLDAFAQTYYEIRKHKGITLEKALDQMHDCVYYGTMMVQKGDADGLVSGAVHTTGDTIRPALQIIGVRPGISVVSSVFFMCLADKVLLYGDCAIVPDPDAQQLADIAVSSADTARHFGIEPYVAMLSYSTGSSAGGSSVDKVRAATDIAKSKRPDVPIEGPIQFDAAWDAEVARVKLLESRIAGNTTVYIFPDLDAGNIAYKAVQRSAGAIAVGPILQGLNKPLNDLSRGCSVEDILYVAAATAVQAQQTKAESRQRQ
jgi:phosphate acetyltransferase